LLRSRQPAKAGKPAWTMLSVTGSRPIRQLLPP